MTTFFVSSWLPLLLLIVLSFQTVPTASSSNQHEASFQPQIMRAWHCHGRNQRDLVDRLKQANIVKSSIVEQVLQVDRKNYVDFNIRSQTPAAAYLDAPQGIGLGQTISAPHMHAHVLEEIVPTLQRQPEPLKILDVGCGSGYLTACLGRLFYPQALLMKAGQVWGMDIYPNLVELSKHNIQQQDSDLLSTGTVQLAVGNGWMGLSDQAPFDAIHVGAAADAFPKVLAMQLKVGGVLIVPIGPSGGVQHLIKVERVASSSDDPQQFHEADYQITELLGVRYVPLIRSFTTQHSGGGDGTY